MNTEVIKAAAHEYGTPSFVFDMDKFRNHADRVKEMLGGIPLCFSIKANPFLLADMPGSVSYVEVCSPGELTVCRNLNIPPEKIIYSGVNKEIFDIADAMDYEVKIITAESLRHIELINRLALEKSRKVPVIIRLTCGNQFGMDPEEIKKVILNRNSYAGIDFIGFHYYSGTQKKKIKVLQKDAENFISFIDSLKDFCGYVPSHVEYGPGIAAEYFNPPYEEKDYELFASLCDILKNLASRYNLNIEMGRFLASSCGTYITSVADIKNNCGTDYVICDGGINHLNYYGQTMAMQIPPITLLSSEAEELMPYTLCGSLCTTADLLVRKVELPELRIGDILAFDRCGAYSVTEGIGLFLSRTLPRIILYSEKYGLRLARDFYNTDQLNTPFN